MPPTLLYFHNNAALWLPEGKVSGKRFLGLLFTSRIFSVKDAGRALVRCIVLGDRRKGRSPS